MQPHTLSHTHADAGLDFILTISEQVRSSSGFIAVPSSDDAPSFQKRIPCYDSAGFLMLIHKYASEGSVHRQKTAP
eukprot:3609527-Pleurochrysis_carterae.AAC.1